MILFMRNLFNKIINFIKKDISLLIVIFLALVFFVATASFNYYTKQYSVNPIKTPDFVKWNSPDENANYIFTKLFAQTGRISLSEKYNLYSQDIMHPRSFRSDFGELKPVSFLGIILIYGTIAKIFSYRVIPFLTPAFAALGIVFFYLFVKRLFSRPTALLAAFLLAAFPVYIYYTVRSMFHNVLFTVLLLMSLYFLFNWPRSKAKINKFFSLNFNWRLFLWPALSGVFLGLAIITRSSELIWVLPLYTVLWFFNFRRVGAVKLLIFIVFFLFSLLPALHYNQILYGNMFFGGYAEMNNSLLTLKQAGQTIVDSTLSGNTSLLAKAWQKIKNTIFYFGFHPDKSYLMFKIYFVNMFFWFFWPAIIGLVTFFSYFKQVKQKHIAYLLSYLTISLILVLYYGSWDFHDNPDPNAATIGNSYTRYWLPMYLGALPFMAYLFKRLTLIICQFFRRSQQGQIAMEFKKKLRPVFCRYGLRAAIYIVILFFSFNFVWTGSDEGLFYLYQNNISEKKQWHSVLSITKQNGVIITLYHDKLFFPERKVIVGLFNDKAMVSVYAQLARLLPLYYYNFNLRPQDIEYLNSRRLKEAGLRIEKIKNITPDFTLYRLWPTTTAKQKEFKQKI